VRKARNFFPEFNIRLYDKNSESDFFFVDFEKAFDTVWRDALWSKLLINNINGLHFFFHPNCFLNHSNITRRER
jgi:hypothetical protein